LGLAGSRRGSGACGFALLEALVDDVLQGDPVKGCGKAMTGIRPQWREVPGNGLLARRNGRSRESGNRKTLPLPKRGSAVQALIEFVRRLRLNEGVARKAPFIEKDG
jgi:hypothetical protein